MNQLQHNEFIEIQIIIIIPSWKDPSHCFFFALLINERKTWNKSRASFIVYFGAFKIWIVKLKVDKKYILLVDNRRNADKSFHEPFLTKGHNTSIMQLYTSWLTFVSSIFSYLFKRVSFETDVSTFFGHRLIIATWMLKINVITAESSLLKRFPFSDFCFYSDALPMNNM